MNINFISASVLLIATLVPSARAQVTVPSTDSDRVEIRIQIAADPDTVWRAITNPRLIKQWYFGVDTQTDWKAGSAVVRRGASKNRPFESKGVILESDRPRRLAHTHWSPAAGLPDRRENYRMVRYELAASGEGTELTVVEENIPNEEARQFSENTWRNVLVGLKAIAERRRNSD